MKKTKKHRWNYPNLIFLGISIGIAIILLSSSGLRDFVATLGTYSYIGALIAGFFFAYALTAAPATASFIVLGTQANPILIGFIAGFGAMIADYFIFNYIKHQMSPDLKYIVKKSGLTKLKKLKGEKIGWIVPFLASFIIASPLPDELGAFIFGISDYPTKKFIAYSYFLNSIGISIVASLG